jgi:hypothetical protein
MYHFKPACGGADSQSKNFWSIYRALLMLLCGVRFLFFSAVEVYRIAFSFPLLPLSLSIIFLPAVVIVTFGEVVWVGFMLLVFPFSE